MKTPAHFRLDNDDAYSAWKEDKLADYPDSFDQLIVDVKDGNAPSKAEISALRHIIDKTNMAVFALGTPFDGPAPLGAFARHFNLHRLDNHLCTEEDGISALQVSTDRHKQHYIPYTNKQINWHTDGYYNPLDKQILGMLLYCARPAMQGGGNRLLDPEIAYIRLRDENPDFIRALSRPDAMSIPANNLESDYFRQQVSGPVFSIGAHHQTLHMRYTARKRHIIWRDDPDTKQAIAFLENLFSGSAPPIFISRLESGQGVLCNNVLHYRQAFVDAEDTEQSRLYFRARYYDRIH
jgi:hypothetical protein